MAPTLWSADKIVVNKLSFKFRDPSRGEVVALRSPCRRDQLGIKRIVALAGDTIEVRCSTTYVNGKAIPRKDARPVACEGWEDPTPTSCSNERHAQDGVEHDVLLALDADGDFPNPDSEFACKPWESFSPPKQALEVAGVPDSNEPCAQRARYTVPPKHVFVLGDNRMSSRDSRHFGPVAHDRLYGRALLVWKSKRGARRFVH